MSSENERIARLRCEIERSEGELAKMKRLAAGLGRDRAARHGPAVDSLEFRLQDAKLHLNILLDASGESRPEQFEEMEELLSDLTRSMEQARVQMEAG